MATIKKTTKKSTLKNSSPALETVGVLGLGIMGSAISGNLLKAGFDVIGFDPNPTCQKRLTKAGGRVVKSAGELGKQAKFIISSLPSANALIESAKAIAASGKKGLVIAEASTLDLDDKAAAKKILDAKGVILLDCPLSGTGAQAKTKDLSIYSSGQAAAVKKMEHVFSGFAKANYYVGSFGNGMKLKLMANLLVAIHNVSTAEAILLGKNWGIDPETTVKVLADGAGGSRMFSVRGPVMVKENWDEATMKVSIWQKDMKLITAALAQTNTPAPLFAASQAIYNAAMGAGHAENDTAAVYDVLRRMSALK